jgi:hypothetical protein
MNASRKNPPSYWGIALRFIALLPKFPSRNKCVRSIFLGFLLLLAMPAHAASTIAGSKLWCNGLIGGCTYSSDTAAAQATYDTFNSWYSKGCGNLGDVRTCIWTITGCDGIGHCTGTASVYAGGTLLQTTDFRYWPYSVTTCPDHSTTNGTDCTCNNGYEPDPTNTQCVVQSCPPNSSGTFPNACTCNKDYEPDPTKTSCVPVSADPCPQVKALTPLPANDACAQALENLHTTQAQKDAACGTLTPALKAGEKCLADKLKFVNIPDTATPIPLKVTSDIRDLAYQAHFREIWDKMEEVVDEMERDPDMQTACAARRAEIAAEKGCDKAGPCKSEPNEVCYPESSTQRSHCLAGRPARPNPNDAKHTQGNAFDVSRTSTINPLQAVLDARHPPQNIQQFLDGPPTNCKLNWGGTFSSNYDPVHFFVP